jgi:hypothetical protein
MPLRGGRCGSAIWNGADVDIAYLSPIAYRLLNAYRLSPNNAAFGTHHPPPRGMGVAPGGGGKGAGVRALGPRGLLRACGPGATATSPTRSELGTRHWIIGITT